YVMREVPSTEQIPIGYPLHNFEISIEDSWGQHCPVGVKGELVVQGIGVGRGYLNQVSRSADRFQLGSSRSYRTGDVARYLPDGRIEFYGREDYQIKIRGHRIELGEIERQLVSLGLRDAVVSKWGEGDQVYLT